MNNTDRLAVITAIKKRLAEVEGATRADVIAEMAPLFEKHGMSQSKARIGDQAVATLSLLNTSPSPRVTDRPAFDAWAAEVGFTTREFVDYEGFGRLIASMHPEMLAEYTEFTTKETVLPANFFESLTKVGDAALFDGTVVDGVAWEQKPLNVRVAGVDTERIIGALAAGAIDAGAMLALPEEA